MLAGILYLTSINDVDTTVNGSVIMHVDDTALLMVESFG